MWLAKAAELVIDQHGARQALIPYDAEHFWESYDIKRGESPSRASLDYFSDHASFSNFRHSICCFKGLLKPATNHYLT